MNIYDPRFFALPEVRQTPQHAVSREQKQRLNALLHAVWPTDSDQLFENCLHLIHSAQVRLPDEFFLESEAAWSERQLVFICYGDHLRSRVPGKTPLQALREFFQAQFSASEFSQLTVHLLPIYVSPYKDGGFDIADPFAVNPEMGSWGDVRALRKQCHVAVDFVANHLSIASAWFERYLHDDPDFREFFIGFESEDDVEQFNRSALAHIYRPRPHHPLIPVKKPDGSTRWVYMTFSDHQADVNYANPFVFLKMAETLLFYLLQGATMVRLDAIPYLWKEWGTPCAHHAKTHQIVELFRLLAESVNPGVKLLAESMEPLADSKRYLSTPEHPKAQLTYNFVPCGLIPHTLITGDTTAFQQHIAMFAPPEHGTTWAVVCGVTHDGSSMNPCRAPQSVSGDAVLSETQIERVAAYYNEHGRQELQRRLALPSNDPRYLPNDYLARFQQRHQTEPRFVNYKRSTDSDGTPIRIVYEAISTYASLFEQQPEKILSALAMALALPGIPFIYLTAPFALSNDFQYYLETGNPRELNRGRVILEELQDMLNASGNLTNIVFSAYLKLLKIRVACPAFHPRNPIIPLQGAPSSLLAFLRLSTTPFQAIFIVQNVSSRPITAEVKLPDNLKLNYSTCRDLIAGELLKCHDGIVVLTMAPHQLRWCAFE
ncbi:sucrose phosphorylase [Candidatus Moduliflexus flocculans]|uniref:Sucrose phosphorylase n=1 Tax=Candidatus Moduliflexus flocculans TaxID=1499966 RepID=A0A0S6VWQ4_9BACT|nr:sucrose phosphorylase [Candidatus Moduliflexus flocculans]